eukprot:CAMPEP_0176438098 /NCGR_PEP_ID=MMETSP0127-20121128/19064_1 /TAXON_ID=938130 /ORGANISM="Platyophrya macrostoma, Strain WH" /LENGTH=279 /DNA_ID=CAMNT_0017821949 /DNA_START=193 /DNA_END=1032 /DNA_ORIENTATION=+
MAVGAILQCTEAFTLGMPFEVWKTQQISGLAKGQWKSAGAEFAALWKQGIKKFYHGTSAKMVESATKGAILLWGTNLTLDVLPHVGIDRKSAVGGMIGGFSGGVMQTVVMSPMTYVITYKNRNPEFASASWVTILKKTGLKAAFGSAPAMAGRQGTNWALRWFFAQAATNKYRQLKGSKLNKVEEIGCGLFGGALGCINQPFEVLRVVQQARQATGDKTATTRNCASMVYKQHGLAGFYAGVIPRMGLSAWQTLFMVTLAGFVKEALNEITEEITGHKK